MSANYAAAIALQFMFSLRNEEHAGLGSLNNLKSRNKHSRGKSNRDTPDMNIWLTGAQSRLI